MVSDTTLKMGYSLVEVDFLIFSSKNNSENQISRLNFCSCAQASSFSLKLIFFSFFVSSINGIMYEHFYKCKVNISSYIKLICEIRQ